MESDIEGEDSSLGYITFTNAREESILNISREGVNKHNLFDVSSDDE